MTNLFEDIFQGREDRENETLEDERKEKISRISQTPGLQQGTGKAG